MADVLAKHGDCILSIEVYGECIEFKIMNNWKDILDTFILQAQTTDLKTATYPKEWANFKMKVSFGMGSPARVPWIAFMAPDMHVSKGFYPVYLYYKDLNRLVLAYGVSETEESAQTWPIEVMTKAQTINAYLDTGVPRYGDSFVFKSYEIRVNGKNVEYVQSLETGPTQASAQDMESDLATILDYYGKLVTLPSPVAISEVSQGLFYMEKQLEDFIIHNWDKTDLGKKYDLIIDEGELLSQQFRTEIGPIDILAIDKNTKEYVVIELKKNQTSDDTVGQLARYMGWIQQKKGGIVRGVIIAAEYDKRLEYALKVISNVEVFLYQVDFKLNRFSRL